MDQPKGAINWRVRFKNPQFNLQLFLTVFGPVLVYYGLTYEDLTTWPGLGQLLLNALSNPFVLGTMAYNFYMSVMDPTTAGIKDSRLAMRYHTPKKE